jgi:hypothetical protein
VCVCFWLYFCRWALYKILHIDHTTQRTCCCSLNFFFQTLPLDDLEVVVKFKHFSYNSKQNEFQGPPKLFKIYPVIQHLSNKFWSLFFWTRTLQLMNPWLYEKAICLSDDTYTSGLQKHMNSVSLVPAMFGLIFFTVDKVWNYQISLLCRNKQNCCNCSKTWQNIFLVVNTLCG